MVTRPLPPEKDAPWPLVVTREKLLTACWGSKKGADLLWHFLNKARWEIKNQNLSISVKVITFNETRPEIFESIASAKAGNSLSQGTYNTMIRAFSEVGYVKNQPYSDAFIVDLAAIEKAFTNPPAKPGKQTRKTPYTAESCVNLTDCNTDTITRKEFNSLVELCVNVSEMCQRLSIQMAELTQMCQSLTQNTSIYQAPQADASTTTGTQNNDIEIMLNDNDSSPLSPKGENTLSAEVDSYSLVSEKIPPVEEKQRQPIPDLTQDFKTPSKDIQQETPAQIKKRLDRRKEDLLNLYAKLTHVSKVVRSKDNLEGATLLAEADATDEEVTITVEEIQQDSFWSKQMTLRVVANQLQNRVNERKKRSRSTGKSTASNQDEQYTIAGFFKRQALQQSANSLAAMEIGL